jgi:hypothetical protein
VGGGTQEGHEERSSQQALGGQGTVRTAAPRSAGGVRRGYAGTACQKKIELSAGQLGRQMIFELQQALRDEGVIISLVKLCGWFGVLRRTV